MTRSRPGQNRSFLESCVRTEDITDKDEVILQRRFFLAAFLMDLYSPPFFEDGEK